ncbi:MAG: hypothetical protein LBQ50_05315 [Planctomycetaceae bacterium]|nr:hypothetical protein [Planctomycetaceae bacterium]
MDGITRATPDVADSSESIRGNAATILMIGALPRNMLTHRVVGRCPTLGYFAPSGRL